MYIRDRVLTKEERKARGAIYCGDGLTEQAHKNDCDINVIMKRYEVSGTVPLYLEDALTHGDFISEASYHEVCNRIIEIEDAFMQLPASYRAEFNHDPAQMLAALQDPSERARLVKAGVLVVPTQPTPSAEIVQPETKTAAEGG